MTEQTASPPTEPILDLGSLFPDRPFIRVDGEAYHLRHEQDLNLTFLARIEKLRRRIADLQAVPEAEEDPEARAEEQSRVLHEAVALVMYDLPDEVLGKLNDVQCIAVMDSFARATLRAASLLKIPPVDELASTLGMLSPASPASTDPTTG